MAFIFYAFYSNKKFNKGRVVVLMYHRIIPQEKIGKILIQPGMVVSKEAFEKQVQYLKKHYTIISFGDFLNSAPSNLDSSKQYCIITFDDGWRDNYDYAFPILKKYGVPATIFPVAGCVNTNKLFWPERLGNALNIIFNDTSNNEAESVDLFDGLVEENLLKIFTSLTSFKEKSEIFDKIVERLKSVSAEDIVLHLEKIEARFNITNHERVLLSWEEITEMSNEGISFGSHGNSHRLLDTLDNEEMQFEIADSAKVLSQSIKNYIPVFCYPNGNFNKTVIEAVQNNNYRAAVTTQYGIVPFDHSNPYMLNRIAVHNDISWNKSLFNLHLSGVLK